jgi:hypothetical protein
MEHKPLRTGTTTGDLAQALGRLPPSPLCPGARTTSGRPLLHGPKPYPRRALFTRVPTSRPARSSLQPAGRRAKAGIGPGPWPADRSLVAEDRSATASAPNATTAPWSALGPQSAGNPGYSAGMNPHNSSARPARRRTHTSTTWTAAETRRRARAPRCRPGHAGAIPWIDSPTLPGSVRRSPSLKGDRRWQGSLE